MKVSTIFLLISLFAVMESNLHGFTVKNCGDYYGTGQNEQGYSRGFCRSLALDSDYAQCCYLKYKSGDNTYYNCVPITLAEYYDIDTAKERIKSDKSALDISIKSLECTSSSYLYGSFLLLLFILF